MSTTTTDPDLRERWEADRELFELAVDALRELEWINPIARKWAVEQLYTDAAGWDASELNGYGRRIAIALYRDTWVFLKAAKETEEQCHFGPSFPGGAIYRAQRHALRALGLTLAALCCPSVGGPLKDDLGVSRSVSLLPLRDTLSEALGQAQEAVAELDGIREGIGKIEKEMTAAS